MIRDNLDVDYNYILAQLIALSSFGIVIAPAVIDPPAWIQRWVIVSDRRGNSGLRGFWIVAGFVA